MIVSFKQHMAWCCSKIHARLIFNLLIILSFLLSTQLRAEGWTDYFPTDKIVTAKRMSMVSSKEIALITQKLQQAIRKNPQWFMEYQSKLKPGEKMPYHVNMGITQAEYETFLKPNAVSLKEDGTFKLEFKWQKKNESIIIKTQPSSPIDGIIIKSNEVITPFGALTQVKQIHNTNKNSLTGAWSGIKWFLDSINEQPIKDLNKIKGKSIQFALGKLEKTGEGILYYDVKDLDAEKNSKIVFSYLSYYPLDHAITTQTKN
jgi:hypothetical protein